jgi:hypothetical protein
LDRTSKRIGVGAGVGDEAVDSELPVDNGLEYAALEPLTRELNEERSDRVEPRCRVEPMSIHLSVGHAHAPTVWQAEEVVGCMVGVNLNRQRATPCSIGRASLAIALPSRTASRFARASERGGESHFPRSPVVGLVLMPRHSICRPMKAKAISTNGGRMWLAGSEHVVVGNVPLKHQPDALKSRAWPPVVGRPDCQVI